MLNIDYHEALKVWLIIFVKQKIRIGIMKQKKTHYCYLLHFQKKKSNQQLKGSVQQCVMST